MDADAVRIAAETLERVYGVLLAEIHDEPGYRDAPERTHNIAGLLGRTAEALRLLGREPPPFRPEGGNTQLPCVFLTFSGDGSPIGAERKFLDRTRPA